MKLFCYNKITSCNIATILKGESNVGKRDLYPALCGKIREKYRTQGSFARAVGMSHSTLSAKLSGRTQWSYIDVEKICRVLDISMAEAPIFFTPDVARLQQDAQE